MKNHFIKNRCLAGAWMVAVMVLSASAAHAQPSAAAGATKYANTCAGCHGAPPGAIKPSVHKASANAAAIPHYLPGDADIAAFVPPSRPVISLPAAYLTANSATLSLSPGTTIILSSYTVSCTGGGATKTTAGAAIGNSTNITVTGLTASTAYNCSATATNASGTGLASAPVSITTNATAPPLPTPIVKLRLMSSGTAVQCPVQYSSSMSWFLRVYASLHPTTLPAITKGLPPGATWRYLFKVNGYPPPGHFPGVWSPSAGVSFVPPARGNYNFEVFAQAWLNEQAISRVSSGVISCKVQ
jgi:opacity protein-like surface antigen